MPLSNDAQIWFDAVTKKVTAEDLDGVQAELDAALANSVTKNAAICLMAALNFRVGNLASSIRLLEGMVDLTETSDDVPELLAVLNALAGRVTEALFYAKMAIVTPPDHSLSPHFGTGLPSFRVAFDTIGHRPLARRAKTMIENGDVEGGINAYEQHLLLSPRDGDALRDYACALVKAGRPGAAIGVLRSVAAMMGGDAAVYSILGNTLIGIGHVAEGLACLRLAISLLPDSTMLRADLVRGAAFECGLSDVEIEDQRQAWAKTIADRAGPVRSRSVARPASGQKIIVGILCDAVSDIDTRQMIGRVAAALDRDIFTLVGLGGGRDGDSVNAPYRGMFNRWRDIAGIDPLTLAAIVRGEGIHVLMDSSVLAGTGRAGLFARQAAAAQIAWLGDAGGAAAPGTTLSLANLDCGRLLMPAPAESFSGSPLPMVEAGGVSFAVEASLAELGADTLIAWAGILHAVPDATILLRHDPILEEPESRDRFIHHLGNLGIAHRFDIIQAETRRDFFALADMALAPFPSCNALAYGTGLALGVPVVAMAHPGRVCNDLASALTVCGLADDLVANSSESYVAKAIALAGNAEKLAAFRASQPQRLAELAPFNAKLFAESLGKALIAQFDPVAA